MLARVMDTDDEWIQERSGIETRYYVEPGVGASDLGAEASRAALADAGVEAEDLDYIVCATMTPDHYFPGVGTMIQQKLGIGARPALDLRQQCAGFAYGLQVVDALVRSGIARTVLLVGCEVHTALIPFSEHSWRAVYDDSVQVTPEEWEWNTRFRHLVVLFGDGAGAMVFKAHEKDDGRGILGSLLFGDGGHREILAVPGVGSAHRPWVDAAMLERGDGVPVMDGRKVFKLAVTSMPRVTRQVLKQSGYELDDLDLLVMHQANLRINEAAQRVLKLPDHRVHNNIRRYGNTTAGTLPICFHEAKQQGKAQEESLVAFTALGAGLHWGSVLMRV
jgi:3-oxoacyl-[acyl-carrier-protein] synthase-3